MLSSCGQTAAQRTDNPKGLPFVRRLLQSQKNFGYTEYILIDCCGKPNSKLCHRFQQSNITKAKAPFYALVILVHPEDKLTISRSNLEILRESIPLIGIKLNKNQVINASGIKTKKGKVMVVDDNSRRANLLKEELNSKNYQVDIFLGSDNYKKALEALETYSVDSPCIVIADERLGLISGGGRTGLLGEYAESGLLFCYRLMKAYPSIVKATMVIAAIKGYSTLHGFYNVGALREVVNSLGISGYITKPINSKNILCVVKKIERVLETEAQEGKDLLLPLSYMGTVERIALSAEFKTKKLHKLIENHIRTVELISSHVSFYRFKNEEVHREMAHKLGERMTKSIKYLQQVVEAIDRDLLSEERVLQPLFGKWTPDKKSFEEVEQDCKYASWENYYNSKVDRRHYISNVYGDRMAKAKFNGVMEDLLRGLEYIACIEAELENFVTTVTKVMAKETPGMRKRIEEEKELTSLKDLFDEIITIREHLKGSIIHQQRQLRIFNEGLRGPSATATGTSSATKTNALVG